MTMLAKASSKLLLSSDIPSVVNSQPPASVDSIR
jgi:hypothetical protein